MKWNSLKNGELLKSLVENNFDALITSDKNIIYQHKLSKYPFRFIIIKASDNQFETILPLIPMIEEKLLLTGEQVIIINHINII